MKAHVLVNGMYFREFIDAKPTGGMLGKSMTGQRKDPILQSNPSEPMSMKSVRDVVGEIIELIRFGDIQAQVITIDIIK